MRVCSRQPIWTPPPPHLTSPLFPPLISYTDAEGWKAGALGLNSGGRVLCVYCFEEGEGGKEGEEEERGRSACAQVHACV